MLEYRIRSIKYGKNKVIFVPVFNEEKFQLLSHFISDDYKLLSEKIKDAFDRVSSKNADKIELAGNSCMIVIDHENCYIEPTIDGMEVGSACTVRTSELKALINSWERDLIALNL